MLDAMRLPVNPRSFGAQAGLFHVEQEAVAVVQRGLSQSGHGGAELCHGLAIGLEQSFVFLAQPVAAHCFRLLDARAQTVAQRKSTEAAPGGAILGKINDTQWH